MRLPFAVSLSRTFDCVELQCTAPLCMLNLTFRDPMMSRKIKPNKAPAPSMPVIFPTNRRSFSSKIGGAGLAAHSPATNRVSYPSAAPTSSPLPNYPQFNNINIQRMNTLTCSDPAINRTFSASLADDPELDMALAELDIDAIVQSRTSGNSK